MVPANSCVLSPEFGPALFPLFYRVETEGTESAVRPAKRASSPRISSIRSRRLYLASRSELRHRADLDLAGGGGNGEVGDCRVFGLARAGRDDRAETVVAEPAASYRRSP